MLGNYRTITLLISVVLIVLFAAKPQYDAAQVLSDNIDGYKQVLASLETYNTTLEGLLKNRDSLTIDEKKRLDVMVGKDGIDPAQVIYNIEQAVVRSGLSLQGVHAYEVQRPRSDSRASSGIYDGDFLTQDFEVTMYGSYDSFKRLLAMIEYSLEPYTVVYVKFTNEESSSLMSFTIRVRAHSLTAS